MDVILIPQALSSQPRLDTGDISFVNYRNDGGQSKGQVMFEVYTFIFVQNGQKEVCRSDGYAIVNAGEAILIPAGKAVITERGSSQLPYEAVIMFFPARLVSDFLVKYPLNRQNAGSGAPDTPYIHIGATVYLWEYAATIKAIVNAGHLISYTLAVHKLEELLLVVHELQPEAFASLTEQNTSSKVPRLKQIIDQHLFNNLCLEELAFLANCSRSTFKRQFERSYGMAPQKYIRERKLEIASTELLGGRHASELYTTYGYESLSNFSTAFKKKFGVTPAAYRLHQTK